MGSLADAPAANHAAPIVAMYNLRATVSFGPKSKATPGQIWLFDDIALSVAWLSIFLSI